MDRSLLGTQRKDPRDERVKPKNDPHVCQDSKEERETIRGRSGTEVLPPAEDQNMLEVLRRTAEHFFPWWRAWLCEIADPRDPELIVYEPGTLIWVGMLMMMTGRKARKQIGYEMRSPEVVVNLRGLCGQEDLETAPHGDTVEYLLVRSDWEAFEKVKVKMIRRLIRKKVLERDRLLGKYYTIAVDGVHTYSFDYKHCEHCVYRGNGVWMHLKLVASLVTPGGFCLPLATEWIENEGGVYDKQDCELKAFYRLIPKLRVLYPRLEMCCLLDSLFCGEPTFEILKKHRMEGIVVFKEGSMKEVWDWVMKKRIQWAPMEDHVTRETKQIPVRETRSHGERITRSKPQRKTREVETIRKYRWKENIPHWDGQRHFNVLTCEEVQDGRINCHYVWQVTGGIPLNRNTIEEVANHGGRCRWKIENQGFNTQKNRGYSLEHPYSTDEVSMKCWNELLDIAHIFRQLIEKGSLICLAALGSLANLGKRLFEHLRYRVFVKSENLPRIQIRFSSPDTS